MMNNRHLSEDERNTLATIIRDAGMVEVLHMCGQMIANDHPDMHTGTELRTTINRVAQLLALNTKS